MGIIKYSIKDILKDAKKYNNRRDWKKKSPGTYEAARPRRRNILEELRKKIMTSHIISCQRINVVFLLMKLIF